MTNTKPQTELEQAKQRLSDAQATLDKADNALASARAEAIGAALKLRDLDHCRAVGLIGPTDAELLAAREAAASTAVTLTRVRSLQEQAHQDVEDYSDLIPRIELEIARDKAIEKIAKTKPELLAEMKEAQTEMTALARRIDERGGLPPSGRESYDANERCRRAGAALEEEIERILTK